MTDNYAPLNDAGMLLEFQIDEPPCKVWRAITIPEIRQLWLPQDHLETGDAISVIPGSEVSYRMKDPSFFALESVVTFRVVPNPTGGTRLQVIHEIDSDSVSRMALAAANNNSPLLMLAA